MTLDQLTAAQVIEQFDLKPLPREGGHWAPLYRNGYGSAILFLIEPPDFSAWHRIPEDELWVHLAGAPVDLRTIEEKPTLHRLGRDAGQALSHLVPAQTWMAATSEGPWSLVVCSLAPAFTNMTMASGYEVSQWIERFPDDADLVKGLTHE